MVSIGVIIFGVVAVLLSLFLIKRLESFEKAELASYLLLFVWGSFLFGLSLTRFTDAVR